MVASRTLLRQRRSPYPHALSIIFDYVRFERILGWLSWLDPPLTHFEPFPACCCCCRRQQLCGPWQLYSDRSCTRDLTWPRIYRLCWSCPCRGSTRTMCSRPRSRCNSTISSCLGFQSKAILSGACWGKGKGKAERRIRRGRASSSDELQVL